MLKTAHEDMSFFRHLRGALVRVNVDKRAYCENDFVHNSVAGNAKVCVAGNIGVCPLFHTPITHARDASVVAKCA